LIFQAIIQLKLGVHLSGAEGKTEIAKIDKTIEEAEQSIAAEADGICSLL